MKNQHLVMGCLHFPFHNKIMFNGVLQLIKDLGKNLAGIHLIGDILDMNSLAFQQRGQVPIEGVTLGWEYKESSKLMDKIDDAIGNRKIEKNFLEGNHENRFWRELKKIDSSKLGSALLSPEEGLRLSERGYNVYTDYMNDYVVLGDHLHLLHGYYVCQNPAKKHLNMLKKSCMFVHTHVVDAFYEGDMCGLNIGWGGDRNAPAFRYANWMTKQRWLNGFNIVTIDDNGFFYPQQITAFNDYFYYGGKRYGK